MKRYLPGGRGQPTVIVPAAIPLSILAALIPCRLGQPVRLRFQQVIQRFFHAPAYKFPDFPLDYFLVQCYNFLGHGLRLLSNVCLATSFYQMTLTLSLVLGTVFNPPVLEFAQLIVLYQNASSTIFAARTISPLTACPYTPDVSISSLCPIIDFSSGRGTSF